MRLKLRGIQPNLSHATSLLAVLQQNAPGSHKLDKKGKGNEHAGVSTGDWKLGVQGG